MTVSTQAAPDGGWRAWMVVFARFILALIVLGSFKGLGVFVPVLQDTLGLSAGMVGFSFGLSGALGFMLGPIMSAILSLTNYRVMVMIGGAMSSSGLILAGQSTTASHLTLGMVLIGVGNCTLAIPAVVALNDYFDKKFSFANGLSTAGGAVGMIALTPLAEILIDTYGWRGGFLIFGALSFNMVVAGALMKPLRRRHTNKDKCSSHQNDQYCDLQDGDPNGMCTHCKNIKSSQLPLSDGYSASQGEDVQRPCLKRDHRYCKHYSDNTTEQKQIISADRSNSILSEEIQKNGANFSKTPHYEDDDGSLMSTTKGGITKTTQNHTLQDEPVDCGQTESSIETNDHVIRAELLKSNDTGYFEFQPLQDESSTMTKYDKTRHTKTVQLQGEQVDNVETELNIDPKCKSVPSGEIIHTTFGNDKGTDESRVKHYLNKVTASTGLQMLNKQKVLLVYLLGFLLWGIVYSGWTLFLVSYAISKGLNPKEAVLLSSLGGVGTLIGRIGHGPFIDRRITTGSEMFSILSFVCSLAMFLYGFVDGIVGLGVLSTIVGMCIGTRFVVAVVVMKENVDEALFKEAAGWCYCFQGIGTALGSPLTGLTFDLTSSFHLAFFILAGVEAIIGVIFLTTPKIIAWTRLYRLKKQNTI